ncbi:MAG: ATP-grasp domain-containing protein, partial [Holophagales bacterium]|nr:ATP-grasp domain-containing protein [Holophagales bacterium]
MFEKILIANRGEIALRIIHACRELGISTVAIHSTADRDSLHVTYADEDICVGPPPSTESYLNIQAVIAAAEITGAQAIHPGYGFLSENAHFAEVLAECKLGWIGPDPASIRAMGDKANARKVAVEAGVPVLPGSEEPLPDAEAARRLADEVGYPVILKASAGGGGRGMRIVRDPEDIARQFDTASEEAQRAFGDGSMYLEKYLDKPRHVEIQVFADHHGKTLHLGERECSIQRRHQKLIEEAPSPMLTPTERAAMGETAVRAARAVDYRGAGTVEFLYQDGEFFFLEM